MIQTINPDMIVLARESRGLSQKELAELLEVTQGYLSKIENGFLVITERLLTDVMAALRYPEKFFLDPSPYILLVCPFIVNIKVWQKDRKIGFVL